MDDITMNIIKLVLVVLLVLMNGFFVAAEFAVVKIRGSRLETLINEGNSRAVYAKKLTDHLDVSLSVTQLGITLASLGLGWLGEPTVSKMLEPVFEYCGLGGALATTISFAIAFGLITAMHIICGELIPKNLAIQKSEAVTLGIAMPMLLFQKVMYPFVWFLNHVANFTAEKLGIPVEPKLLKRNRKTVPQKELSPSERLKNLTGAFLAESLPDDKKRILLVDDIYTTGSTLEACARVLKNAGAEVVYFVVIFMTGGR